VKLAAESSMARSTSDDDDDEDDDDDKAADFCGTAEFQRHTSTKNPLTRLQ
jgi:hypothetical protein